MKPPQVTIRTLELAAGAGFIALGVLLMIEAYSLGPGWGQSGPRPGFFPFSLALVMALAGLVAVSEAFARGRRQPFFENAQEVDDLLRVGIPLALAIASVGFLGFYIMAALYIAFFTWWYGRFRWPSALVAGAGTSFALFMLLERGFRIPTPRSPWYGTLLPF